MILASALLAGLLAALVGAGELLQRYRDAPFNALITIAGLGYLTLHVVAGMGAYLALHSGNVLQLAQQGPLDWREILTAGFGTLAFFRSAFFTVRMDDKDVGMGPGTVLQQLLTATDRAVDRIRAEPRSAAVREIMQDVDFDLAAASLPELCFNLMQNVSPEEREAFAERVADLRKTAEMDTKAKAYSLGLGLMNIVGEKVLRQAVDTLGGKVKDPTRVPLPVIAGLRHVDFHRNGETFAQACLTLSGQSRADAAGDDVRARLRVRLAEIDKMDIKDTDKSLFLAIELLNQFGERVISAALAYVEPLPPRGSNPPGG